MDTDAGSDATQQFRQARDYLQQRLGDHADAVAGFSWPQPSQFNWALDWLDVVARDNARAALWIVQQDGESLRRSYHEMSRASDRLASWLREKGSPAATGYCSCSATRSSSGSRSWR